MKSVAFHSSLQVFFIELTGSPGIGLYVGSRKYGWLYQPRRLWKGESPYIRSRARPYIAAKHDRTFTTESLINPRSLVLKISQSTAKHPLFEACCLVSEFYPPEM